MQVKAFFDSRTFTLTYVVRDPATNDAIIIDPVLDYDPAASKVWAESVEQVIDYVRAEKLNVHYILETHAHADHLSGSQLLKRAFPQAKIAVGERITVVQQTFKTIFNLTEDFATDGSQFDRLLKDGEILDAGSLKLEVIFTPGHTPACATYKIEDAIFTGDAIFMPDGGTGRCDFPAGSAKDLYHSISSKLYALPDSTRVFVGHDYQPGGREVKWETTIGDEKQNNIQLKATTSEDEFIQFRAARDKTLAAPKLLFQSVQVNIDAGKMPKPSEDKKRYLKIPINVFNLPAELRCEDIKETTV
jgi:glyoxylase-like metal-dependent hydrolase (beta-lactamase superfamily II)